MLFTDTEFALVQILEVAQSKVRQESDPMDRICVIAHKALGSPSQDTLRQMKRDMMEERSMADLVKSGGIVDAP